MPLQQMMIAIEPSLPFTKLPETAEFHQYPDCSYKIIRQEAALKSTNFRSLGRVPGHGNKDEPTWHQRAVNIKAVMIYPASGFRDMQEMEVKIIRISEGDAIILTGTTPNMHENFYLYFDVLNNPPVACWVYRKTAQGIYCRFQNEMRTATVERIIVEHEMRNTLDSLWGNSDVDEGGGGSPLAS